MIVAVTKLETRDKDPQKMREFGMLIGGSAREARAHEDSGGFGSPGLLHLEAQREGDIYWTYTVWESQAELDDFMQNSKTHNEAIQRSQEFGETTTKRWEVKGKVPSWKDAKGRFVELTNQKPEGAETSVESK